jgi:hypothetical protein
MGAVLKKIKILGFGGLGLKIYVPKEHSCPAPALEGEGEGRIYHIFGVFLIRAFFNFGEMPENTQSNVFLGVFNGFLPGEPRLGCRKWTSGFFRASGNHPRPGLYVGAQLATEINRGRVGNPGRAFACWAPNRLQQ